MNCSNVQFSAGKLTAVLYNTVQGSTLQYCTIQHNEVQLTETMHSTVQAVHCSTVYYSEGKYNTVKCSYAIMCNETLHRNIARIAKSCTKNIPSKCFFLKDGTITTVTTSTVNNTSITILVLNLVKI